MGNNIHQSAVVSPTAELENVSIGPFAVIEDNVQIQSGCTIAAHAVIKKGCQIGENTSIGEGSVLGGNPQDHSFDTKTPSGLVVGHDNIIRENVTIHRASKENENTTIGNHNMLMAVSHLAHDVHIGNHNVVANNSLLAGHVQLGHYAFISGNCAIHQFVRIGDYCMLAGITKLANDAPPYCLIEGFPGMYRGLNVVGLKRSGMKPDERKKLKTYYHQLYESQSNFKEALSQLESLEPEPLLKSILNFIQNSKRGLVHRYRK